MAILDEVKRMLQAGKSEIEISSELQRKGFPQAEIRNALSESQIKEAVAGQDAAQYYSQPNSSYQEEQQQEQEQTMQPSMITEAPQPQEPQYPQEYSQAQYPAETQQPQYTQYQQGTSTDVTAEIAEQIIDEKLSPIRRLIEKAIDAKTISEAKISSIEERLKRIENIIDKLQISLLQKVGDYLTNTEDLKREIIETQKSFKAVQKPKSIK